MFLKQQNVTLKLNLFIIVEEVPELVPEEVPEGAKGGRPCISFAQASGKTKRRKSLVLAEGHTADELLSAAKVQLKMEGRMKEENIISRVLSNSIETNAYSNTEALALMLDTKLSKRAYCNVRDSAKKKGISIYPPYYRLLEEKKSILPAISATDYSASVNLQELLDITVDRIMKIVPVQTELVDGEALTLITKYGFDGATSQAVYMQAGIAEDGGDRPADSVEQSLFLTCMVPLKLKSFNKVIWENNKPSSTLFCRLIRFRYVKESKETILEEERFLRQADLAPTNLQIVEGVNVPCFHSMELTMVDGKIHTVLSPLTDSTQCCSVCGISPSDMNKLDVILAKKADVQDQNLQYGLSTLHASSTLPIGKRFESGKPVVLQPKKQ